MMRRKLILITGGFKGLRPLTNGYNISFQQRSTSFNSTCYGDQIPFHSIQHHLPSSNITPHGGLRNYWPKVCNRLVPSHFSCPRCSLWVEFDEFVVHQGKDGKIVPFSPFIPRGFARIDRLPIFQCEKE